MKKFTEIIDSWPSLSDFAADLGVPYVNAQVMRHRDSIPPDYWSRIEDAAARRRIKGITAKGMAEIRAKKRQREAA